MVIPIFLDQRAKNQALTIVGDGQATRDYVHVSDVAQANILAWKSKVDDGTAVNIGSGEQTSVNEIARLIGGDTINIPARPGEMRAVQANNAKAKELLGWQPTIDLEAGIAELKKEWWI